TKVGASLSVALLLSCAWLWSDISGPRARELVAAGALLVDVRTPEEFAMSHIEGARNIPVGAIDQHASELAAQGKPIVLYCRSGAGASRAQQILREAGAPEVYNLGAMSRW